MASLTAPSITTLLSNLSQDEGFAALLNDSSLQALYCSGAGGDTGSICAICANTDIAGIGVRVAFYAQAIFNALQVLYSPDDSTSGQWAAVILTLALLIPATTQKAQGNLTLFHASLVLNFATLSTLASLAVAPRCTVWRAEDKGSGRKRETRGRVVLSLALVIQLIRNQLVLQWSWAVYMFTSPSYAQPVCNGPTLLLFFGYPIFASSIDPHLQPPGALAHKSYFFIYPLWLLFSMGLTMGYFAILSISSGDSRLRRPSGSKLITPYPTGTAYNTPRSRGQSRLAARLPRFSSSPTHLIRDLIALLLFVGLVTATEVQHAIQPYLLPGEDEVTTFGQMAALLLATAPLWSLGMAWFRGYEVGEGTKDAELRLPLVAVQRQTWGFVQDGAGEGPDEGENEEEEEEPRDRGRIRKVVLLSPQTTPDEWRKVREETDGTSFRCMEKRRRRVA
ncbi:hypothetical protein DACRYDRAFT_100710 [Dacryopinax primogenitus]|uniref:Uncharacterized protein n=1 Tax=Dacryopinax primogenitus (strain DJM 731) TaxID=1858805 RepID=M5FSU4_DACPD|nr:uncharacterized protein DACRYDRAFT_100710 [Dacryopinax primogenitus]EJU00576.1 hypothetical protein DACRYDRAFT_100710 [Dacryopinax primogenitus]